MSDLVSEIRYAFRLSWAAFVSPRDTALRDQRDVPWVCSCSGRTGPARQPFSPSDDPVADVSIIIVPTLGMRGSKPMSMALQGVTGKQPTCGHETP